MGLFLRNLDLYARLPPPGRSKPKCSVLIPARNEEAGIASAIHSVLRNENADLEVIVLDDGSTDHTAEIVRKLAAADARVRFETALPLPPGWCGKQHACYLLAHLARHPLLVFMDADVRLEPDALARMAAFMEHGGCALASGIPREEMKTFSERLLIPLIHFIMLGFLPIQRMRATMDPACSAGCGQLFIARRDAYHACGGHRAIRDSLHDGAKLPRVFRSAGFKTDLFDATDIANCRMFLTNPNVWRGLGRNAHEGLAAPRLIGPATLILFGGQICPLFLLVAVFLHRPATGLGLAFPLLGTAATFLPRLLAVGRFRQPLGSALLHPIGICGLLAIQWLAFFRARGRRPSVWKGRSYLQSQPA
jgi:hypothetical protein